MCVAELGSIFSLRLSLQLTLHDHNEHQIAAKIIRSRARVCVCVAGCVSVFGSLCCPRTAVAELTGIFHFIFALLCITSFNWASAIVKCATLFEFAETNVRDCVVRHESCRIPRLLLLFSHVSVCTNTPKSLKLVSRIHLHKHTSARKLLFSFFFSFVTVRFCGGNAA